MFTVRRGIPNRVYGKEDLQQLGSNLREAGFGELTVKLPHNLVGAEKHEVSLEEFVERGRNYPATILVARSEERCETIKVLFVNISSKTFFIDDTFPSGHSEPSELFVQSPDPARVYSLSGFFEVYFGERGRRSTTAMGALSYMASLFVLAGHMFSVLGGTGLVSRMSPSLGPRAVVLDWITGLIALIVVFSYYRVPNGLYINPLPNRSLFTLFSRAIRGEVMDNPLVSFIVTVVTSVATAVLLKVLGIL